MGNDQYAVHAENTNCRDNEVVNAWMGEMRSSVMLPCKIGSWGVRNWRPLFFGFCPTRLGGILYRSPNKKKRESRHMHQVAVGVYGGWTLSVPRAEIFDNVGSVIKIWPDIRVRACTGDNGGAKVARHIFSWYIHCTFMFTIRRVKWCLSNTNSNRGYSHMHIDCDRILAAFGTSRIFWGGFLKVVLTTRESHFFILP